MSPRSYSITGRLVLALTLGTTVFWCIAAIGASWVFSHELDETFDTALKETAQRLLPLAIDDLRDNDDGEMRTLVESPSGQINYLVYQISSPDGRVLARTSENFDAPPNLYDNAPERGFSRVGDWKSVV